MRKHLDFSPGLRNLTSGPLAQEGASSPGFLPPNYPLRNASSLPAAAGEQSDSFPLVSPTSGDLPFRGHLTIWATQARELLRGCSQHLAMQRAAPQKMI